MAVGVVVLYYRNWPTILQTIESVRRSNYPIAALLVVDNESRDEAAGRLRDGGVDVLELSQNLGYAAGMRAGVDALRTRHDLDAVLLLTHEVILDPIALETMIPHLADAHVAAVGPILMRADAPGVVYAVGGEIDAESGLPKLLTDDPGARGSLGNTVTRTMWIDGSVILVSTRAWDEVGGFDDSFFLYYEDAEFGVRCNRLGYHVLVEPRARALSAPAGFVPEYLAVRGGIRFLIVTGNWTGAVRLTARVAGGALRDLLDYKARSSARERLDAVRDGWTGRLPVERIYAKSSKNRA